MWELGGHYCTSGSPPVKRPSKKASRKRRNLHIGKGCSPYCSTLHKKSVKCVSDASVFILKRKWWVFCLCLVGLVLLFFFERRFGCISSITDPTDLMKGCKIKTSTLSLCMQSCAIWHIGSFLGDYMHERKHWRCLAYQCVTKAGSISQLVHLNSFWKRSILIQHCCEPPTSGCYQWPLTQAGSQVVLV